MDETGIIVRPVGIVRSSYKNPMDYPVPGRIEQVEVYPQYTRALHRIEENSHLWLLLWFHQSDRTVLSTVPRRMNPDLPEYGVFGLRSPKRPNPIALTLVKLESVQGNLLLVSGLDAIDGTPVLDIKSYYEQDSVFSPRTPYFKTVNQEMRRNSLLKQALNHHQEACSDLYLAVRMALAAEEHLGKLNRPDLKLLVTGSACLADTLQGLSRARLANPPRFAFKESAGLPASVWTDTRHCLKLEALCPLNQDTFTELADHELFKIDLAENQTVTQ